MDDVRTVTCYHRIYATSVLIAALGDDGIASAPVSVAIGYGARADRGKYYATSMATRALFSGSDAASEDVRRLLRLNQDRAHSAALAMSTNQSRVDYPVTKPGASVLLLCNTII